MSSRTTSLPTASCSSRLRRAQLEHLAEHGDRAGPRPAAADRGQRLERGAHRVGVGVVGVVEHRDAVGALGELHPGGRGGGRGRQRGDHGVEGYVEGQRHRGDGGGVGGVVLADQAERHACAARRRPPGRRSAGRASSSRTSSKRTSASAAAAEACHPGRRTRGHRGDQRVVGVEHRDATPSAGGSASTISPLACAIASWEPNSPMCALPTLSTRDDLRRRDRAGRA